MSTNFPSALDTFTNPNGSDSLNAAAVPHAEQHANANDAIEALQAKVGINGSAVATSLDYRISTAETGLGGKISSSEKGSANGVATLGFDGKVPSSQLPPLDYIPTSEKGAAGGVAGLDEAGKVPAAQLPSYVDDVLEYANVASFPVTGETGKIYIALDTNKVYRWSGSTYVYITSGAVDSVAGKTGVVSLVKADVGLSNVDNTTDLGKPISIATQAALDGKASSSHVGATGTAHGVATTSVAGFMSATDKSKLDGVATGANNYTHPSGDGNLHVPATGTTNNGNVLKAGATAGSLSWGTLAKDDVGLGNVDNTSDANKPISTATQTALNLKVDTASPTTTGTFTHSGNIVLSGSGKRITGDFSNATAANRVMFQTSTVDGNTAIAAIPSGTGIKSMWGAFGSSDPANSSTTWLFTDNTASAILADKTGTGTYLPMTFYTGGSERMRIDASGNVLVKSVAGLGYGQGAGGTVTQATSKSTTVTLNKPCGQITMNNAALAAGQRAGFLCINSLVLPTDIIVASVNHAAVSGAGYNYSVYASADSGGIVFILKNDSSGSLSEAVVINFAIIKGATA